MDFSIFSVEYWRVEEAYRKVSSLKGWTKISGSLIHVNEQRMVQTGTDYVLCLIVRSVKAVAMCRLCTLQVERVLQQLTKLPLKICLLRTLAYVCPFICDGLMVISKILYLTKEKKPRKNVIFGYVSWFESEPGKFCHCDWNDAK